VTGMFDPHDDPNIDSVWLWFEFQMALIGEEHASVLRASSPAGDIVMQAPRPHQLQFIGHKRKVVDEFFDRQRSRTELLTMFELLATTEAILRIEFKARVTQRKKDALSRRFREIHKTRRDRVRLDEDILAVMKEEGMPAGVVGAFRGALRLRHWLAHGKHWHPKLGRDYTPGDVFDISRDLIDSI
jgi:hypothetical protein